MTLLALLVTLAAPPQPQADGYVWSCCGRKFETAKQYAGHRRWCEK